MKIEDIIRVGNVDSINPENGTVRVRFPDRDDKVSGELKVIFSKTHMDKDYHIPDIDEAVVCIFLPNQQEEGFVLGAYYNEVDTIPGGANENTKIWSLDCSKTSEIFFNTLYHTSFKIKSSSTF